MEVKRGILFTLILLLLMFFFYRFVGYAIQTYSEVTIHVGITVLANTFDGSTTNFLKINDTQLQSINNMILERTDFGEIVFNNEVNLTENAENKIVDLDSNVNISSNYVSVTDKFNSLHEPATIYLYNLSFKNPIIIHNNEICECKIDSYSNGILSFDVGNFSGDYYIVETPGGIQPSSSGGGGATIISRNFTTDKNLIKVELKQGESKQETIEIMNVGTAPENITIDYSELKKFLILSEDSFILNPGKVKIINADFFAKEDEIPDAYAGRILINSEDTYRIIDVIVEVKAKEPLFDISTKVLQKNLNIGGNVTAKISIVNMGDIKKMDVSLYYAIKNFDGQVISFKEESIAITDKLNLQRTLEIPQGIAEGTYIFYSKVSGKNISAASVDTFDIKKLEIPEAKSNEIIILIALVLLLLLLLILIKIKGHSKALIKIQKKVEKIEILMKKDKEKARALYSSLNKYYKNLNEKEKEIIYPKLEKLRERLI